MEFIRQADAQYGGNQLRDRLIRELESEKKVLWLLTGGSGIAICVRVMAEIPIELTEKLTVALTDERYGPIGHDDSNWQQLDEQGFDAKQARRVEVLQDGLSMAETAAKYAEKIERILVENDSVVGIFGMGPDGHTAGILPDTLATVDNGSSVIGYSTEQFDRITITFASIRRCDAGYLFAFGDAKRQALENLQRDAPLNTQPAQILKELKEVYVYNDQIGEVE